MRSFCFVASLCASAFLFTQVAEAQLSYSKGQPTYPAYEGWLPLPDGSYNLMFGYMNDNWLEETDVPVGPNNNISPGPADQGQPTRFYPRRNRFVFSVHVPLQNAPGRSLH